MNELPSTRPGSTLTLAVPYYSGFELLLRTLRSLGSQTYTQCNVLLVDDSPEGLTREQQQRVQVAVGGRLPLTILRNQRNLGMALTWNRCLDEAGTDLVSIIHGDDELEPTYAEQLVDLAARNPYATALFCGARIISASGNRTLSIPDLYKRLIVPAHGHELTLQGDSGVSSLLRGNYIFCPTLCYRRSRLGTTRFDPRYRMVPDLDLVTRILLEGGKVVGVPKQPLYRYRRHADNATQRLTRELTRFTEECAFYADIEERAAQQGFTTTVDRARARSIIKKNLLYCVARDFATLRPRDGVDKLRLYGQLFL